MQLWDNTEYERSLLNKVYEYIRGVSNIFKIFIFIAGGYEYYRFKTQNPQENVISVQMNVVVGNKNPLDVTSLSLGYSSSPMLSRSQTNQDAWKGKLMWNVLSSAFAPDKHFQSLLASARNKPLALAIQCPTLCLLDTGPYYVDSVLWQKIYGFASSILSNTQAMTRAACDLPVQRRRVIGCLTFESAEQLGYNTASRKMRMLLISRKHLRFLLDNPSYGSDADSNGWARQWQNQRLVQLNELAQHVKNTGGFDDMLYVEKRNDRYYFQIEVWLNDYDFKRNTGNNAELELFMSSIDGVHNEQ